MRKLCEQKEVGIVEAEVCPDHIHMLLEIPPKMSVSGVIGYLKGKKLADDLRTIWESEVQISKSGVLVPQILRGYYRKEYCKDKRINRAPVR